MASHTRPQLSLLETIWFIAALAKALISTTLDISRTIVQRTQTGWPLQRIITVAFLRHRDEVPFRFLRSRAPTTGEALETYAKAKGIGYRQHLIDRNRHGLESRLHFLSLQSGPRQHNPKVFFYLHGGGYFNPIDSRAQIPFALACARKAGAGTAVFLEYGLAPEARYPTQLIQAVEALRTLLQDHALQDIIIAGDSVGGNLALALTYHLAAPSPYAPPIAQAATDALRAVLLVSPWVSLDFTSHSYSTGVEYDMINRSIMEWITGIWAPKAGEAWAEPAAASADLLQRLPVQRMLLLAGEWEAYRDGILLLADKLGAQHLPTTSDARFEVFVAEKEVHVQCIMDSAFGLTGGKMYNAALDWLASVAEA